MTNPIDFLINPDLSVLRHLDYLQKALKELF